MAVKRASKKIAVKEEIADVATPIEIPQITTVNRKPVNKLVIAAIIAAAGLGVFWYKTNSWPVAAVVNGKVVTRFALNQALYKQGGKTVLDSLVTEQLIKNELDKQNVQVTDDEIENKYKEIIKSVPEDVKVEELLAARGMTVEEFKKQIAVQIRVDKATQNKSTVTTQEIDEYLKENEEFVTGSSSAEKRSSVEALLKNQKSQQAINSWIDEIRKKAQVWTPDGSWSAVVTEN